MQLWTAREPKMEVGGPGGGGRGRWMDGQSCRVLLAVSEGCTIWDGWKVCVVARWGGYMGGRGVTSTCFVTQGERFTSSRAKFALAQLHAQPH